MNTFILIAIATVIILYIFLKFSHLKARVSFIFLLIGVLFILFLIFIFTSGSNFSFSSIDGLIASGKLYFLWIKSVVTGLFQFTGKVIGIGVNNSTAIK